MARTTFNELLEAGVHFGHLRRKWNPQMAPYIFMEQNGIHIIDLHKTTAKIDEAANVLKQIARSGKKILFVATKKQAKEIVAEYSKKVNMPYMTERWTGGMLTNFATIRKAVKKISVIDKYKTDGTFSNMSKRERLQLLRERAKLEKDLGSVADLTRLPSAIFVIDISKEHIAVSEAKKLNIPTFAVVDTNSNPNTVDYPIPANDDASKSIELIIRVMTDAIKEGLDERKVDKERKDEEEQEMMREKFIEERSFTDSTDEVITEVEKEEELKEEAEKLVMKGKKDKEARKVIGKIVVDEDEDKSPVKTKSFDSKKPGARLRKVSPVKRPNKPINKK